MITKHSTLIILVLVVSLSLSTTGMAVAENVEEEQPELQLTSISEIMDETGLDFEEAWNRISNMECTDTIDTAALGLVWNYIAGVEKDVISFKGVDITDKVNALAADVGDIDKLNDASYEEIDTFMSKIIELDEVEDITEDTVKEIKNEDE